MNEQNEADERAEKQNIENEHDQELVAYLNRIGARSLANELSDLRFLNRIVEAHRTLDSIAAEMSYEERLHDTLDQRLMANQSFLFDKAQTYTNFVVTLGYAGFFAIWSLIKNQMNAWDMKLVAVLLGISLMVFIVWTLINMTSSTNAVRRIGNALSAHPEGRAGMLEAVKHAEMENLRKGLKLQKLWLPAYAVSVATGFAAGTVLLLLLMFSVAGSQFSLHNLFFEVKPSVAHPIPIVVPSTLATIPSPSAASQPQP